MWAAFAIVIIACGGTAFMVRFLIALLREGSPSVCYWEIPVVAAEGEERAQEVFETGLEFDVRISHGRLCKFSAGAMAGGESLGSYGTNGTLESGRKEGVRTKQAGRRDAAAVGFFLVVLLIVAGAEAPQSDAQTEPQQVVQSAKLNDGVQPPTAPPARDATAPDKSTSSAKPAEAPNRIAENEALAKELEAMKLRIEQLEAELKARSAAGKSAAEQSAAAADFGNPGATASVPAEATIAAPANAGLEGRSASIPPSLAVSTPAVQSPELAPAKKEKIVPFSDWDWTWLNGNPRTKEAAFDSKFFTPEIRADVSYTYDFNKPVDNSMGGSSEIFRSNEIQLEQLGVGGDFHYDNVRARLMTQFGMYSTATPRNDASPAKGQWDLSDAYRYVSEAYGGYHINALNGINIDAGIFMSYIGLFSFYNFDNWAYQPSYVSSNTPWFFNGLRVQIFPTSHLKIEPWFINGWQSYGSANSRKGVGGQIKWTPRPWVNVISNNYGLGHDDLYIPNRGRVHTDDSIEIKYFDRPGRTLDKMAFTFTGDMGCEFGPSTTTSAGVYLQGVGCHGDTKDAKSVGGDHFAAGINPKQSFVGFMLYNRMWFKKDRYALTVGGGQINNPGRYLVLDPPINGETAPSAAINAPYFTGNPSDPFKAWDSSVTFDYMPSQYITFRWEYDYRHASVPYWSGRGGVTPPGSGGVPYTNNGYPQFFACNDGNTSMQESLSGAQTACSAQGSSVWFPDLRRDEQFIDMAIMVKF